MQVNQKSEPTKTILVITVGMLVLHLAFEWKWALYTSLTVGVLGALSSFAAETIHTLWQKLTWVLSLIVPNILLSAIFFFLLTPIAWLSRIFGEKNPLGLRNEGDSTFVSHQKKYDTQSFEKPW